MARSLNWTHTYKYLVRKPRNKQIQMFELLTSPFIHSISINISSKLCYVDIHTKNISQQLVKAVKSYELYKLTYQTRLRYSLHHPTVPWPSKFDTWKDKVDLVCYPPYLWTLYLCIMNQLWIWLSKISNWKWRSEDLSLRLFAL